FPLAFAAGPMDSQPNPPPRFLASVRSGGDPMLEQIGPAHPPASYLNKAGRKLIMVSNRGPVEHFFDDAGRIRRREAAGGVATALGSVARQQPVTWIATAATDADKAVGILDQRIQIGRD